MTRIRIMLALCVALVATGAIAAVATAKKGAGETELFAFLTGKNEAPAKGDPDGHARVTVTLEPSQGKVCFDIRKTKLETAVAAHIHTGKAGKSGPVLVAFFGVPTGAGKGKITGCVKATTAQIAAIKAHPANYYVNIHTKTYPGGAVRGQLGPHA